MKWASQHTRKTMRATNKEKRKDRQVSLEGNIKWRRRGESRKRNNRKFSVTTKKCATPDEKGKKMNEMKRKSVTK